MLIDEKHVDVPTKDGGSMRMLCLPKDSTPDGDLTVTALSGIFLFVPSIPNYPKAKFPGVVVFSEIYQGRWTVDRSSAVFAFATSNFATLHSTRSWSSFDTGFNHQTLR